MDTTAGSTTMTRAGCERPLNDSPERQRVTLAADLVDWVRRASYIEIGVVAEELDEAVSARGREGRPDRFQERHTGWASSVRCWRGSAGPSRRRRWR
jgi:hypothetical protein